MISHLTVGEEPAFQLLIWLALFKKEGTRFLSLPLLGKKIVPERKSWLD